MSVPVGKIGLDGRARGRVGREVAAVDAVHRLEVAGVPEKHVDRDDIFIPEPVRRQLLAERVQGGGGLLLDGGCTVRGAGDVGQVDEFGGLRGNVGREQKGQDRGRDRETNGRAIRDAHGGNSCRGDGTYSCHSSRSRSSFRSGTV